MLIIPWGEVGTRSCVPRTRLSRGQESDLIPNASSQKAILNIGIIANIRFGTYVPDAVAGAFGFGAVNPALRFHAVDWLEFKGYTTSYDRDDSVHPG